MPDLFDGISGWLQEQALGDLDLPDIIAGMAERLRNGGVPVARVNIGRVLLHPAIGLINHIWSADTGQVSSDIVPRELVVFELEEDSPFSTMSRGLADRVIANLSNPDDVARYKIFGELAASGITGYVAFSRVFGPKQEVFASLPEDYRGSTLSFATRGFSGFSDADVEGLERLITPLCVCLRGANDRFLAIELLETYLGRISGKHVLTGHCARGDTQTIECALFYSDMHGSLALSQLMPPEQYLELVNQYFDCTAGAVLAHGGEVLTFIGDGVLAIFPFEGTTRPAANMCRAALATAREAFARAAHVNGQRAGQSLPQFDFGVALHVGEVIYGNVGTDKRLDFTATGAAVGLVNRCEGLTRSLDAALIATEDFADLCSEPGRSLGAHALKGFPGEVPLVGYGARPA